MTTKENLRLWQAGSQQRALRKFLWPALAAVIVAAIAITLAGSKAASGQDNGNGNGDNGVYSIGLWGDLPYSDVQAQTGVPNLIADMNSQHLAFTAHDGDLKAGNGTPGSVTPTTCIPALYQQALGYFNSLNAPAIFTPGDNDWTDCDRASNGGVSSLGQLDYERQLFFSTAYSLGKHRIFQEVQLDPICLGVSGSVACVENRRWTIGSVTYATLNIQGSCNNLCDTDPDSAEYAARNAADIEWMQQTFDEAKSNGSVAIMFISQADPGFDKAGSQGAPERDPNTLVETDGLPDGFHDFLVALRKEVVDFGNQVAYVHGDSHYFRVDKPLMNSQGFRVENFTRVETFGDHQEAGDNDVNWLKVTVDAHTREIFSYQPQIVPPNKPASPTP
jgi:hypothetical protein